MCIQGIQSFNLEYNCYQDLKFDEYNQIKRELQRKMKEEKQNKESHYAKFRDPFEQ